MAFLEVGVSQPSRKYHKNTKGPVGKFPEKFNLIVLAVTDILSFIQNKQPDIVLLCIID